MIAQKQYEGEGLSLVYDEGDWVIGIKNYKVANDISTLKTLEKHNKTDESFVLLHGSCTLIAYDEKNEGAEYLNMAEGTVYTISSGVWHTTIMKPGTKMILIERSGTSMDNSELLDLPDHVIAEAKQKIE